MRLLLDTHVALWAFANSPRLQNDTRALIEAEDNHIYVSAATIWEISIKHAGKRGDMPISGEEAWAYRRESGFRILEMKAQQNIISVQEARHDHADIAPHLQEIIGALWLRSIAVGNLAGLSRVISSCSVAGSAPVDDNAFQVELTTIVDNSFNIH
jgi:PIN domain nuclease of toxin-antitoxin system